MWRFGTFFFGAYPIEEVFIMKNSADQTIQLHDGRTLGFLEYGSSTGKNLFYFHGHPGSRVEANFLADELNWRAVFEFCRDQRLISFAIEVR